MSLQYANRMVSFLSVSNLVHRIHTINHGWKVARERFGADDALANSFRDLKARLQVRLLRHPDADARIEHDADFENETIYSIRVSDDADTLSSDAAHIPHRVLERHLSTTEMRGLKS